MIPLPSLILLIACALTISFLLGYSSADSQNIKYYRRLDAHLVLAQKQRYELTEWIQATWPTEYTAYCEGHAEGYQQGVSHAQTIIDEADK